jgi:hypothetical protein
MPFNNSIRSSGSVERKSLYFQGVFTLTLELSDHAFERSIGRNVSLEEIDFIVEYGYRERRTGAIFCQLRAKDMPKCKQTNRRYGRLVGTTVVLCGCGQHVITLYRGEKAFKQDRRKAKYDSLCRESMCACSNLEAVA